MKLWNRKSGRDGAGDCAARHELLSRYLDNDLRGEAAASMAAHLRACTACRAEFEAFRAQRAILAATLTPRGAAAARARVLTRFEASVHATQAKPSRRPARPMTSRSTIVRPAFAMAVVALGLGGVIAARTWVSSPHGAGVPTAKAPGVARTNPPVALSGILPLPERGDLDALLALHDARTKAAAVTNAPKAAAHASSPSSGERRRTRYAADIARYAAAHSGEDASGDVTGDPATLPPDELPEAL